MCTTLVQLGMLLQHVRVSIAFPYGHGKMACAQITIDPHMVIDVFGPSKYYFTLFPKLQSVSHSLYVTSIANLIKL
jgi:hypothetical protein